MHFLFSVDPVDVCTEERCQADACSNKCEKGCMITDKDGKTCACLSGGNDIDKKSGSAVCHFMKSKCCIIGPKKRNSGSALCNFIKSKFYKSNTCATSTSGGFGGQASDSGLDPPCSNPYPAVGGLIDCTDDCLYQEVCAKYMSNIMSNMSRTRSGFTVNMKRKACPTCQASTSCQNRSCYEKPSVLKHLSQCTGSSSSSAKAPEPCHSPPCPKRKLFRM